MKGRHKSFDNFDESLLDGDESEQSRDPSIPPERPPINSDEKDPKIPQGLPDDLDKLLEGLADNPPELPAGGIDWGDTSLPPPWGQGEGPPPPPDPPPPFVSVPYQPLSSPWVPDEHKSSSGEIPQPQEPPKTLDTSETIANLKRAVGELGQQVKEGLNAERPKELSEQALEQLLGISKESIQASEQALEQLISISNEAIQASEQLTSRLVEDAREGMERLRQLSEEAAMGAEKIRQSSEEQNKQIAEERGKEVQRS